MKNKKQLKFVSLYLKECLNILNLLDKNSIERAIQLLSKISNRRGRLFICGSGGGAGHASHAVNDFRKLAKIESYCPSDNVSELTARINDEGWENSYADWLLGSRINNKDCVIIFSVGGGCLKKKISVNLVNVMKLARKKNAKIIAITGRNGGEAKKLANVLILVPTINPNRVTPHTESFQAILWHLLVSHPRLAKKSAKW